MENYFNTESKDVNKKTYTLRVLKCDSNSQDLFSLIIKKTDGDNVNTKTINIFNNNVGYYETTQDNMGKIISGKYVDSEKMMEEILKAFREMDKVIKTSGFSEEMIRFYNEYKNQIMVTKGSNNYGI